MIMRRNLLYRQCDLLNAACFSQRVADTVAARSKVHRYPSAQIGKPERARTVAPVGRADQVEQRLVLRNRQQLSFAEHPARGSKIAGEDSNLANVGLCHRLL